MQPQPPGRGLGKYCGLAAVLLFLLFLPRPRLSVTMHHAVSAPGSSPRPPVRSVPEPTRSDESERLRGLVSSAVVTPTPSMPTEDAPPPAALDVEALAAPAAAERGGYTFFSTDYHIAPIADVADVFDSLCRESQLCMNVEEQSFSGACGKTFGGRKPTCARGLKVINQGNGFDLCPRPHALRRAFFNAYKGPMSPLQHVDAFVCNHPPALCELYMPFNKSLLVIASVNLEFSRENPTRWSAWLASLRRIARDKRNVVAANNKYDAEYIRYFAGVDALYIPSFCGYAAKAQYAPVQGKPVLIARNHNNPRKLYNQLHAAAAASAPLDGGGGGTLAARPTLRYVRTEDAYPRGFEYTEIAQHPAVVVVPYTKSVMSFFELYRMNVPLFAPSVALLVDWEEQNHVMAERIYWSRAPRPTSYPNTTKLSPNTRKSRAAMEYWLALSDLYAFPNVTYFDSWQQLQVLMREADLPAISAAMKRANAEQLSDLRGLWRRLFMRMFAGQPPGYRRVPTDYAGAMRTLYGKGAVPSMDEPPCRRESRPEHGEWT
tara:strand:+ start:308 stop:1945 length:1638 start_codon:yes stop_codon:yes gene_type:complete